VSKFRVDTLKCLLGFAGYAEREERRERESKVLTGKIKKTRLKP